MLVNECVPVHRWAILRKTCDGPSDPRRGEPTEGHKHRNTRSERGREG